ncbi:efflux RND transporter permease subunit [Candidatus Electronema sp. JM]|uniref:efflux RND transporter permease subunit n=1 Tax=Candidatus Electronema sp. JM TaxID=3401571 RepID=UPI003AA859E0
MRAEQLISFSLRQPKAALAAVLLVALAAGAFLSRAARIDTDLVGLLPETEQLRTMQVKSRKAFGLHDMMVLGVVNTQHPDGVFNPETLKKIHVLSRVAATLADPAQPEQRRIAGREIISLDTVEKIGHAERGQARFAPLMAEPPATREEALQIRAAALADPLLKGTVVSEDGKAAAIWLPIINKDFIRTLAARLRKEISALGPANGDEFHFAGLPIAEAASGRELKRSLFFYLPLALLTIFLLTYLFSRSFTLAAAPVLTAACSALFVMGLLTGTGHALHSLSLLIPLFIMPAAVSGTTHLLVQFLASPSRFQDQRQAVMEVLSEQAGLMFWIALTASVGFAALAFSPVQPVQDFSIFVGIGLLLAWLLTVLIVPACIMLTPVGKPVARSTAPRGALHQTAVGRPWTVLAVSGGLLAAGVVGLLMLQFSGSPVAWFAANHEVRRAEQVLQQHFAGIYDAALVLSGSPKEPTAAEAAELLHKELQPLLQENPTLNDAALNSITVENTAKTGTELLDALTEAWNSELDKLPPEDQAGYAFWTKALAAIDNVRSGKEIFKRPDLLRYLADFQAHLSAQGGVGKSKSLGDLVKKVHQELYEGDAKQFIIPDTVNAVAETLVSYQNSHQPDELRHFVTPDYTKAALWLQLRAADSNSMKQVIAAAEQYFASHPPPVELRREWTGQTHINMIWQENMLAGLLKPLPVSIGLIFLLLTLLFRSPTWGLLAMLPLFFTIMLLCGALGLSGKQGDILTVLLTMLALGLVLPDAVYFLRRARMPLTESDAVQANAILPSIVILAAGFAPLLLAPLTVPYQTASLFLAAIMLCSGAAMLWVLPALLTVLKIRPAKE